MKNYFDKYGYQQDEFIEDIDHDYYDNDEQDWNDEYYNNNNYYYYNNTYNNFHDNSNDENDNEYDNGYPQSPFNEFILYFIKFNFLLIKNKCIISINLIFFSKLS